MKNQTFFGSVAGIVVVGFVLPVAAGAVDVPPVTDESVFLGVCESRETLRLRNGEEVPQAGLRVSDNKQEVTREDGCKVSRPVEDMYGPNLTWENCSSDRWGTGWIEDVSKSGQL